MDGSNAGMDPDRRSILRGISASVLGLPLAATAKSTTSGLTCAETPFETGGPFVADGRNGPNLFTSPNIFRSDIRTDLAGGAIQSGVELLLTINLSRVGPGACRPEPGRVVYLWQSNAAGDYSAYVQKGSMATASASFLRGMQETDNKGQVSFRTIFPGQYPGRAPHLHVRVYSDRSFSTILKTTQIAFDDAVSRSVISASSAYALGPGNSLISNRKDFLFRDGTGGQMIQLSGNPEQGFKGVFDLGFPPV